MLHPNVDQEGQVHLRLLSEWKPENTIAELMLHLREMMERPDESSIVNRDLFEHKKSSSLIKKFLKEHGRLLTPK